jgi:type IV secretion system protein VirD4
MPQEVMQDMRADDQIVFVKGQRPIRCGRAIFFRRPEMRALVGESRFQAKPETPQTTEPPPDGPSDPGRQTAPS